MTVQERIRTVRTHLVPLAFFIGGGALVLTSALKAVFPSTPAYFSPPVGIGMGALYLLLGGAYEWTIQKQKETQEWYEQQKKLLNELEEDR